MTFIPKEKACKACNEMYLALSGVSLYCKTCKRKKKKEWIKKFKTSPKGILSRKKYDRSEIGKAKYARYRATKKYKTYSSVRYRTMTESIKKARYSVHNAVRDGRLKRPRYCERCLVQDWGIKRTMIEAHHYKGYEPEHWLTVQWLCTNCHKEADTR